MGCTHALLQSCKPLAGATCIVGDILNAAEEDRDLMPWHAAIVETLYLTGNLHCLLPGVCCTSRASLACISNSLYTCILPWLP